MVWMVDMCHVLFRSGASGLAVVPADADMLRCAPDSSLSLRMTAGVKPVPGPNMPSFLSGADARLTCRHSERRRRRRRERRIPCAEIVLAPTLRARSSLPLAIHSSYQSAARSAHSGFADSMSATFLDRSHPLICFSRAIALTMSGTGSQYASRVIWYRAVKPPVAPDL